MSMRDPNSFVETMDLSGDLWQAGVRFEDEEAGRQALYELVQAKYVFAGSDAVLWSLLGVVNGLVYVAFARRNASIAAGSEEDAQP